MTPQTPAPTAAANPDDLLQFIDDQRVALIAGNYEIAVEQRVSGVGAGLRPTFRAKRSFTVQAERFALAPEVVLASFPPAGSRGDWWRVLPHVILSRSTLPWERTGAAKVDPEPPWVALLLFSGDEPPTRKTVTVGELVVSGAPSASYFASLANSSGPEQSNDPVNVIDVDTHLLQALAPRDLEHACHVRRKLAFLGSQAELVHDNASRVRALQQFLAAKAIAPLAHPEASVVEARTRVVDRADGRVFEVAIVRDVSDGQDKTTFYELAQENVVVIGNRLPARGQRNVVHLVSLERRMLAHANGGYELDLRSEGDTVRLVSLHKWEFFCEDTQRTFKGTLQSLNRLDALRSVQFHLPAGASANPASDAERFLRLGFVPMRHRFRQGGRGVSWYHGPLAPIDWQSVQSPLDTSELAAAWRRNGELAITCADELMVLHREHALLDVSYAAAWQLGRLLTLANTNLAMSMYRWKRRNAHLVQSAQHLIEWGSHLSIAGGADAGVDDATLPDDVWQWLDDLTLLKHVPFGYLVPDERLLPPESIRLFAIDKLWVRCLRDGAFSIGRVTPTAPTSDHEPDALPDLSGMLLRSEVVSGWPRMQVDGVTYEVRDGQWRARRSRVLRSERLSPNVLLVIFEGAVQQVELSLPPEVLHFGFDLPDDVENAAADLDLLVRQLRDRAGSERAAAVPVAWSDKQRRVVSLANQAREIAGVSGGAVAPSQFALQMISGAELVRFST